MKSELLDMALLPGLIGQAAAFAIQAHNNNPVVERRMRKYVEEPYWIHPARVAQTLINVGAPWGVPWDEEVIAAALLHDVVEDCPVTGEDIKKIFGPKVAQLVDEVTNPSKLIEGSREVRKAIDREHLKKASPEGMSIKLADIIDNTPSIVEHAPDFAFQKYLPEMRALLPHLVEGHPVLFAKATQILKEAGDG